MLRQQFGAARACIDYFKEYAGLDVQKMYPAAGQPDKELVDIGPGTTSLPLPINAPRAGNRSASG